jgi:hypothetical protein
MTERCYGSRIFQDWVADHNHRTKDRLREGETLDLPSFDVLVSEQIASRWGAETTPIAQAYAHFRSAESDIEGQFRAQPLGPCGYRPTIPAKTDLRAAASALRPLVERLEAAGVRSRKFASLRDTLESLASGTGTSWSSDYTVEGVLQDFFYGVSDLSQKSAR